MSIKLEAHHGKHHVSHGPVEVTTDLPSIRRRHTSEGEVKHDRSLIGPLNYIRYPIQEGGAYTCDGQEFHVTTLKSDPDITVMKPKILQEIKAALLDVSPQITPGQSTLSYADIVWDMSSSQHTTSDNQLRSMLCKINQQVQELTKTTTGFNGVRLIYAYNRTTKINLKPVNQAALPLVIVHIGKKRDLSITPTRFNPAIQSAEICDVIMGAFSMVILPYNSVRNVHTFFASEKLRSEDGDEQILLIPFSEKTFAPNSTSMTPTPQASSHAASNGNPPEPTISAKPMKLPADNVKDTWDPVPPASLTPNSKTSDSIDESTLSTDANQSTLSASNENPSEPTIFAKSMKPPADNVKDTWDPVPPASLTPNSKTSDSIDESTLSTDANQSTSNTSKSSTTNEPNRADHSSGKCSSISLEYITLDLLKRAANSYKKSTLNTLMPSLGLKGSKNVSMNKKKLCDLLDKCVSKGSKHTVHLVTHLVNKLEDCIIRMELLANYLPLNTTAQERKKALIAFYKDQCQGQGNKIKLIFHSTLDKIPDKMDRLNASHFLNATTSNQNNLTSLQNQDDFDSNSPDVTTSVETNTRFQLITPNTNSTKINATVKKKKSKKKKSKGGKDTRTPQSSDINPQQTPDAPVMELPGPNAEQPTATDATGNDDHSKAEDLNEAPGRTERECSNCSELKTAITVLQESILTLREEMLQQKAISDLLVSTPSTSDKKLEQLVKNKLHPILDNQKRLRADLNLLRETVDEQNRTLGLLADKKDQPHQINGGELSVRIEKLEDTRIAVKTQIETLEMNQENMKKAIKSVATTAENHLASAARELNGEFNDAFQSLETVSSSNRSRIETLEINHENLVQSQIQQEITHQSYGVENNPENDNARSAKQPTAQHNIDSRGKPSTNQNNSSWAHIVSKNKDTKSTQADKRNRRNHNEVDGDSAPTSTGDESQRTHNRNNNLSTARRPQEKHQGQEPPYDSDANRSTTQSDGLRYRRHTALLIHDELFDDFNPHLFSNQFNVHSLRTKSYEDLSNKTRQLNNTLKRLRPDCIYIHTGINDVLKRKAGVTSHIEELSDHLLESTKAQICFSLMIPSTNDSALNTKINKVNSEIVDYISWLHRKKPSTKSRIFSFTNDSLESYNVFSKGNGFSLRERGQKLLWLRLREGMRKTMRITRANHQSENRPQRKTNRFSHK